MDVVWRLYHLNKIFYNTDAKLSNATYTFNALTRGFCFLLYYPTWIVQRKLRELTPVPYYVDKLHVLLKKGQILDHR